MFLSILKYGFVIWLLLALARVFLAHSLATHWVALRKFFFIWVLSTSPIICAALLARPTGVQIEREFDQTIYRAFSLGEQFVYAATFVAPLLYLFIEAVLIAASSDVSHKVAEVKQRLRGIGSLLLPAIILIIVTVLSFAAARNEQFQSTFLFTFLGTQSLLLYGLALGIWYASMLVDSLPNVDLAEVSRNEARDFAAAFKRRMGAGEAGE